MAYSKEEIEWLKENVGKVTYIELVKLFNEKFSKNKTYNGVRSYCLRQLAIKVGNNGTIPRINDELAIKIFLANTNKSFKEIADIYNQLCGTNFASDSIEHRLSVCGYKLCDYGHTQGNTHNESLLGNVKQSSNGYELIKVRQGTKEKRYADGYIPMASYCYEKFHNEKVGKGEFVIFLDGNNRNYSKDNLVKITKSEGLQLNKEGLMNSGELTLAMLDIIRLKAEIREVK